MADLRLSKELYFTTTTVVDWMDVFTRPVYKQIVVDSLRYCQASKGLDIYAWVLMTNHLHMVVGTHSDHRLGDVLRDFKKFTSKAVVRAVEENEQESRKAWLTDRFRFRSANDAKTKNYKFWQDGSYVETIYSYEFFIEKRDYIHMNPVKQEIVDRPEHYLYSSARDYCGERGLIDVIIL